MHEAPVSAETPISHQPELAAAAKEVAVRHPPDITRCSLTALNDEGLVVELSAQQFETVPWLAIVAVAAGVVPRPTESGRAGGMLLVDIVIAWSTPDAGPRMFRFDSDMTAMATLFPSASAGESYVAFLRRVFERADAVALPELTALMKGAFPRYPTVAARDEALFS
jgi:hypothetical protein